MSDSSITQQSPDADGWPEAQDWTVTDLQEQVGHLTQQLSEVGEQVQQLQEWAGGLPARHQPEPHPVRLADLASTELETPLSLARRVIQLRQLLGRAGELTQALMPAVATEAAFFARDVRARIDADGESPGRPPELAEVDQAGDDAGPQISLVAHCHSAWDDDQSFERQRQAVRRVLTFDGNRTWHGTLTRALNDDLTGWHDILAAVEAGAHVEIQLP
jgi:hypothetical protein